MRWQLKKVTEKFAVPPFALEEVEIGDEQGNHLFYRLRCPEWVNVLPITQDGKALLVKQSRIGLFDYVLETPGGVVESHEKDLTLTAVRELEEETGYTTSRVIPLASIPANPATHNNLVHFFLAFNCSPAVNRIHFPDAHEDTSVQLTELSELDNLVRTGQIKSCYSSLCIMLAQKYLALEK